MNVFICIDDTDNYESIGTGQLLEEMMAKAGEKGLCTCGFTVRYQLFLHDDIPYTSHNSSMCCTAETAAREALTAFCEAYLAKNAAPGSDPGLCVLTDSDSLDYAPLIAFGKRAQNEIVTKEEAYAAAAAFGKDAHLSEHGGTGLGVIGALAGAALRAGKCEGRIKGKLYPVEGENDWTTETFAVRFGVQRFTDNRGNEIAETLPLAFRHPTKLIYQNGQVTAVLVQENGVWMPKPKIKKE